jgi:hypothetical protein
MRIAFKEWAIVVDALARGEQIIVLRKGGISEGVGGFKAEHQQFLLFPTLFHQQRESVIERAQGRFDQIAPAFPPAAELHIESFAEVVDARQLRTLEAAQTLRGQHIWRDEVIAERFDWGRSKEIYVMALRVFRLPQKRIVPLLPAYGGCKSWIELAEEIATANSEPVLDEQTFFSKLDAFQAVLESVAQDASRT